MEGIISGVAVGVIIAFFNLGVKAYENKKGKSKAAIGLLLKCNLVVLGALKKSGIINGDCDDVKAELEDFVTKRY